MSEVLGSVPGRRYQTQLQWQQQSTEAYNALWLRPHQNRGGEIALGLVSRFLAGQEGRRAQPELKTIVGGLAIETVEYPLVLRLQKFLIGKRQPVVERWLSRR